MNTQPKEVTYIEASSVWDIAQYLTICIVASSAVVKLPAAAQFQITEAQSVYCNRLSVGVVL